MKKLFLLISIVFLCTSCPEEGNEITYLVTNLANETIYFYDGRSDNYTSYNYPDTLIQDTRGLIRLTSGLQAPRNSGFIFEVFAQAHPSDTLSFFFFEENTVDTIDWQTIREEYLVLKRYDLSAEDIIALDHLVPYPPSEDMANMKQFPPYDE